MATGKRPDKENKSFSSFAEMVLTGGSSGGYGGTYPLASPNSAPPPVQHINYTDGETKELLRQLIMAVNMNTEVCKEIVKKLGSGLD